VAQPVPVGQAARFVAQGVVRAWSGGQGHLAEVEPVGRAQVHHLSQLRLREEVGVPVPVGVEQLLPWRYREVMAERRAAPPPPLTAPCTAEEWAVAFATTYTDTSCTEE